MLWKALVLAVMTELVGCAGSGPAIRQPSLEGRIRAHQGNVEAFNKHALAIKADADAVSAEARALSKHPAFPAYWKKLEEAIARGMADEPTDEEKQAARTEEFLQAAGMSADEEKIRRAMRVIDTRIQFVMKRNEVLERWRGSLNAEREAIMQEIEHRRLVAAEEAADAQQLAAFTSLMGALQPAPRFQTSCTTSRIGRTVYTDCQ